MFPLKRFAQLSAAALLFCSLPALADSITLNSTAALGVLYQQTANSPCIFSQKECVQQTLPYTQYKNPKNNTFTGTQTYTVAELASVLGSNQSGELNSFFIGLNVNQNNRAQTLSSFTIGVNQHVLYSFNSCSQRNVPTTQNPGSGYADWLLSASAVTPFSFGDLNENDRIFFSVKFKDLNAGPEQLFLIPDKQQEPPSSVPEPASVVMVLTGLTGLGVTLRNRFGRK